MTDQEKAAMEAELKKYGGIHYQFQAGFRNGFPAGAEYQRQQGKVLKADRIVDIAENAFKGRFEVEDVVAFARALESEVRGNHV